MKMKKMGSAVIMGALVVGGTISAFAASNEAEKTMAIQSTLTTKAEVSQPAAVMTPSINISEGKKIEVTKNVMELHKDIFK